MSYNGSGTFNINTAGQPVVTGTVISSTAFNALTADLATGLSTAITKDGQTTTTARIVFAQGISSTLVTDATSATTGSIITAGGISTQKALWVGTTSRLVGAVQMDAALTYGGVTISNSVTGTGSMVLSASPTLTGTLTAATANFSGLVTSTNALKSAPISGNAYVYATRGSQAQGQVGYYLNGGTSSTDWIMYMDTSSDLFRIFGNSATRLAIDTSGNVGIGMTPSNVLDITKNQNSFSIANILNNNAGTTSQAGYWASNGTNSARYGVLGTGYSSTGTFQAGYGIVYASSGLGICAGGGPILFGSNGTAEVARIGTNGSLLVGTTTNGGWGTDAKIEAQASTGCGVSGYATGAGGASLRSRGDTDTTDLIAFYRSTTKCGSFISSGGGTPNIQWLANNQAYVIAGGSGGVTLASAATAWAAISDETLKTDLATIQSGAEKVGSLRAVTGRYKTDAESMSRSFLIAQDVQKVLPEAVSTGADGTLSLRYTEVIPLMVAAIQELTTRLAALENN